MGGSCFGAGGCNHGAFPNYLPPNWHGNPFKRSFKRIAVLKIEGPFFGFDMRLGEGKGALSGILIRIGFRV